MAMTEEVIRGPRWTQEEDHQLITLMAEGKTFSECAAIMKRPRNSCIGRANRKGWKADKKGSPPIKEKPPKSAPRFSMVVGPHPAKKPGTPPAMVSDAPPTARRLTLMQLNSHTCHWAVAEDRAAPGRHFFCGAATPVGDPYCAFHHRMAYQKNSWSAAFKKACTKVPA